MKLSYDPRYNIAYLQFHEKAAQVEAVKLSDSLVVDIGPDGTVYGIEFLNANEQLEQDLGKFFFVNEATGQTVEVPL